MAKKYIKYDADGNRIYKGDAYKKEQAKSVLKLHQGRYVKVCDVSPRNYRRYFKGKDLELIQHQQNNVDKVMAEAIEPEVQEEVPQSTIDKGITEIVEDLSKQNTPDPEIDKMLQNAVNEVKAEETKVDEVSYAHLIGKDPTIQKTL